MKKITNPQLTSITLLTSVFLSACGGAGSIGPNLANTVQPVQTCSNGGVNFPTCTPPATPANLQLVVAQPPFPVDSDETIGFNYLNNVRASLGLGLLNYSPELQQATINHNNYLKLNERDNYDAHNEDALRPGFTGVTASDQARFAGYTTIYGACCIWCGFYTCGIDSEFIEFNLSSWGIVASKYKRSR
jgi:hypothetical protein